MKLGIIGFARGGKTTIFNALTGAHAAVGAFGSRDANLAVLKVPDERVDRLAEIYQPKKKTYAEFEFVDVAPNESTGDRKALDSAALTVLRNAEALVHVVRAFAKEEVVHPLETVDSVRDCRAMEEELQLSDLIVIEKRLKRLAKERTKGPEPDVLNRCSECLESGKPLRTLELSTPERLKVGGFGFLSQKPLLLLGNYGEGSIGEGDPSGLETYAQAQGQTLVALCGVMEMEVAELPEEERQAFREDLGLGEESRTRFLRSAYENLGLISFFTVGDDEVRAWTVPKDSKAIDAAGLIHSDIQRGFIRAEAISYDHFIVEGSMAKAKEHGHLRLEGRDYVVQDGDMLLFRFNV